MTETGRDATKESRIYFLDNLRTFMIFLLGSLCHIQKIFEPEVTSKKFYSVISCTAWIPLNLYIVVLINIVLRPGSYLISETMDIILFWLGFHLSLFCMLYLGIATFRYFFNRQGNLFKALNANSYGVYIIHVIIIGCLALIMLNIEIPSLAKYLILAASAWIISNLITYGSRCFIRSIF